MAGGGQHDADADDVIVDANAEADADDSGSAHLPQRALNLKSCVLPIFLQEPLKHIKIDHSG